jgi:hypothetical protein
MLYIDDLGQKRIRIKEIQNGTVQKDFVCGAKWTADISTHSVTIHDMTGSNRRITANLSDLVINGQPAPQDPAEAYNALSFIGTVSSGGGNATEVYISEEAYNALSPEEQGEQNYIVTN